MAAPDDFRAGALVDGPIRGVKLQLKLNQVCNDLAIRAGAMRFPRSNDSIDLIEDDQTLNESIRVKKAELFFQSGGEAEECRMNASGFWGSD